MQWHQELSFAIGGTDSILGRHCRVINMAASCDSAWSVIPESIGKAECAEHDTSAAERCSPSSCSTLWEFKLVLRFHRGKLVVWTLRLDFWLVHLVNSVTLLSVEDRYPGD